MPDPPAQSLYTPRKFYFVEYFYIFLKSVEETKDNERAFEMFRLLKEERGLGESKFRRLTGLKQNPTVRQLERFRYTFKQVAEESKDYNLVTKDENGSWKMTPKGKRLLASYGNQTFRHEILRSMESRYEAFSYLVKRMYDQSPSNGGLLVFPLYSPLELSISKQDIKTTSDIAQFGDQLRKRIANDCKVLADRDLSLPNANETIIPKLREDGKLPPSDTTPFERQEYTAIISRFRKFWFSYLLREVYRIEFGESIFEIWAYRGKQLGTINVTEAFPGMSGRIVYPVSLVAPSVEHSDFSEACKYKDGSSLWLHEPQIQSFLDTFVDNLTRAYLNQRRSAKAYFTSLYAVREIVCLKCRVSEKTFESFLNEAYERSLRGHLRIRISLEVDRMPVETSATYRQREPITVRSQAYNIIGIDFANSTSQ